MNGCLKTNPSGMLFPWGVSLMKIYMFVVFIIFSIINIALAEDCEFVSLMQLIVTPEKFSGKRIDVIGYVIIEEENTAIWFHKEDAETGNAPNAYAITMTKEQSSKYRNLSGGYVDLIGVFKPENGNVLDMLHHSIVLEKMKKI